MSEFLNRPRFQFSLRGLLIAMTVVAILLGLIVFPLGQMIVGLLLAVLLRGVLPTVAVAAAIYGQGRVQAFAIGAVVSCLPILFGDLGPLSFFWIDRGVGHSACGRGGLRNCGRGDAGVARAAGRNGPGMSGKSAASRLTQVVRIGAVENHLEIVK
jgi:hypothetical protein